MTVLATLAQGDASRMLADDVVSAFTAFQRGVPICRAYDPPDARLCTTRWVIRGIRHGACYLCQDARVPVRLYLHPFGIRHDSPLYGIGALPAEKHEVLQQFAQFASQAPAQKLATEYGFDQLSDYTPAVAPPRRGAHYGGVWKTRKTLDALSLPSFLETSVVPWKACRSVTQTCCLLVGSQFIDPENSLGLVVFNQEVKQLLPVGKFTVNQQALFTAAVQDMSAGRGTAMATGSSWPPKCSVAKAKQPECKPLLIVLTDETNAGLILTKSSQCSLVSKFPSIR